jgi:WD40 repeat protein/tRNA A-37 threonylcarbamoyl transferase component Bud32
MTPQHTAPATSPPSLADADTPDPFPTTLEGALEQFERAWLRGERPALEGYLPAEPAYRRAVLVELACAELEFRLKAGEPARASDYLGRFPELAEDAEAVRGLARTEFEFRRRAEPELSAGAFLRQFPQCPSDITLRDGFGPADPLLPQVPGFEIVTVLGRGGMGVVYKARQPALKRFVALKMMLPGGPANAEERQRFRREAEAAARLQHPNVVQVFEVGEAAGVPYAALEFVDGGSLADRLRQAPVKPGEAAALVEVVSQAVHLAHARGVVHRDLKPANVLLTLAGVPKVADFGLARKIDEAGQTQTGAVLGTPSYMAPEQAAGRGHAAGPAADIYSLGAILYECLTGRPPFKAATALETLQQVQTQEPPSVRALQPGCPRDLETICLKCLRKEPGQRYASARELAEDLRHFQAGEPIRARPTGAATKLVKWVRRRPTVAVLVAVSSAAVLALLVGGFVYNYRLQRAYLLVEETQEEADRTNRQATEFEAKARKKYQAAADERREAGRTLSAAQQILYALTLQEVGAAAERRDYAQGLVLLKDPKRCPPSLREFTWGHYHRLCKRDRLTLNVGRGSASVALAPDGETIAVGRDAGVEVYDARTGQLRTTLPIVGVTALAFSLRDPLLAAGTERGTLVIWDLAAGAPRGSWAALPVGILCVALSRDGKTVAVGGSDVKGGGVVNVWDMATRAQRAVCRGHTDLVLAVALAPDGRTVATGSRDFTVRLWDAGTGKELARLSEHMGHVNAVAFSPDGSTLASGSADGLVKLWALEARKCRHSLQGFAAGVYGVAYAANGTLAAGYDNACVKLWDTSSGKELALFRGHKARVRTLAASADGRTVASRADDGTVKVWHADLESAATVIAGARGHCLAALSDGQTVAFVGQDRSLRLWDMAAGRERARWAGVWRWLTALAASPDGKQIVTGSSDGSLWVWRVADGKRVQMFAGHAKEISSLAFALDGRTLASASRDLTVKLWDTARWTCRATFRPEGGAGQLAFAPDGKSLAAGGACLRLWDVATGQELMARNEFRGLIHGVGYSPDGQTLAMGCGDGTLVLWDVRTRTPRTVLSGHSGEVLSLAYAPDGRTLASAATDGTILVWDTATLKQVATLRGHKGWVPCLAFTPDSRMLLSSGLDRVLRLWGGRP